MKKESRSKYQRLIWNQLCAFGYQDIEKEGRVTYLDAYQETLDLIEETPEDDPFRMGLNKDKRRAFLRERKTSNELRKGDTPDEDC